MHVYAELISPGDHIRGAEVLWVQRLWEQEAVLVALDVSGLAGAHGAETKIDRYRADELVEIDSPPDEGAGGHRTGLS